MIILDVPQLSEEWFAARTGIPSASHFDKIVTSTGAPSKQSEKYLYQLAAERITSIKEKGYTSDAMKRGVELEAEARNLFEMTHDVTVKQVGLCYQDESKLFSCSPDGLMEDSGIEIKCPLSYTHVGYLFNGGLPTEYIQQVQGSMLITGFSSWFFMSYFPGLPALIINVKRDAILCAKLQAALALFCKELDAVTEKIKGLK